MAQFTTVNDPERDALCEAFALGDPISLRPITAGTINSNFELTTTRGRYFLRVNEGKSEADVAWEADAVASLAAAGIATPPPLPARDGKLYAPLIGHPGKWANAFAWRAGYHLAAWQVDAHAANRIGRELAALHVAGLELPPDRHRPSIYAHEHLVTRYKSFAASDDPALVRAIAVLDAELTAAAAVSPIRAAATHGLIHGDLFRDNVLWNDGEIVAMLDFEQASGGSLIYDLAVVLNDWCWDGGPQLAASRALLAGYQSVRPLTAADRAALPVEVRAAAARFTITRITDVYLAKVANPEKDFRDYLARCEAWQTQKLGELAAAM